MQPGGGADSHRGGTVPFVLSTCVDVGIGIAEENVHSFGAGGSHFGGLKAELVGDVVRDGGRTVVGHNDVAGEWPEDGFDVIGVGDYAEVGQADGEGENAADTVGDRFQRGRCARPSLAARWRILWCRQGGR